MKLVALTLATCLLGAYAQAQTPSQSPTPTQPAATAPAGSSSSGSLGHACKKEVKDLCGRAHGQEMQDCIKSGMDMNKFSADCKAKIAAKAGK